MKIIFKFLLVFFITFISCKNESIKKQEAKKVDSVKQLNRIELSLGEVLIPKAKKELQKDKQYLALDDFITQFYNISTNEALSNAKELNDLVKTFKDSLTLKTINKPSVIARINVLYSESLRLSDMESIAAIHPNEIKQQVAQIMEVYSSLNAKINTLYKTIALQSKLQTDTEKLIKIEAKKVVKKFKIQNNTQNKRKGKIGKPIKKEIYEKN
ncbi:MAG: hypothetical protein ACWA42_02100 [Lutibacter sp.]